MREGWWEVKDWEEGREGMGRRTEERESLRLKPSGEVALLIETGRAAFSSGLPTCPAFVQEACGPWQSPFPSPPLHPLAFSGAISFESAFFIYPWSNINRQPSQQSTLFSGAISCMAHQN